MVKSNLFAAGIVVCVALVAGPVAQAGGNRGPESVCGDLIGSEYAACHTYCEALKCGTAEQTASPKACDKALARFLELSGGVNPPCLDSGDDASGAVVCPCSIGWNRAGFVPEGWSPSACETTSLPSGGERIRISGDFEDPSYVEILAEWRIVENSWNNSVGFLCGWMRSGSEGGGSKDGLVDSSDRVGPDEQIPPEDRAWNEQVYDACESDLEDFLARFDMSLEDCVE